MKKKKLISLVLAGTMVFGLAACGSNGGDKKSEGDSSDSDKVVKVAVVETAYGADMWNDVRGCHSATDEIWRVSGRDHESCWF